MPELYSRVVDGNQIGPPGPLPFEGVTSAGAHRTDLAGQHEAGHLTDDDLRDLGFWPIVEDRPAFDGATHQLVETGRELRATDVLITYAAVALSPPDLDAMRAEKRVAINAQRDQRMRAGFSFAGAMFDYDDASQRRITGAAALAGFALTMGGKAPDDLRWHGGGSDFVWIAQDNSLVPMNTITCFGFGQAAAAWEQAHIFAARGLKDAVDAAADHEAIQAIDITAGWPG
jgi:hypothetical protein